MLTLEHHHCTKFWASKKLKTLEQSPAMSRRVCSLPSWPASRKESVLAEIVRGGNFLQVGGEFLFVKETEDEFKCTWAHRMKTTRGHSDVETLRDLLLGKPAAAEQETAAIPVPSAVAVGAVPAMPTVPEKTAVNAVKKSDRLSRRLSGRLSALLRKDSNENGVKSEKANGKAPAVDQSVVVPAEPVVAETLAPVQPELTMNGGTIRPVIGSPVL